MDQLYKNYVDEFLSKKHIIIAGYSSKKDTPANDIYKKLKDNGYEVYAVNPKAREITDVACYETVAAVPVKAEAVFVCTPAGASANVIEESAKAGINLAWIHKSIGEGSYSEAASQKAKELGVKLIPCGCPMMFIKPDIFHKCFKFFMRNKLQAGR